MKKIILFYCLLCGFLSVNAQVTDDFSDGNFSSSPTWVGETSSHIINTGQLHTNGAAVSDTTYLSTSFGNLDFDQSIIWEYYVELGFSPSTSNTTRTYLVADNSDLRGSLNGYYLRIGESGSTDAIKFYKQSGTTSTLLFTGTGNTFGTSPTARIRITRNGTGNWTFESDNTGGTTYIAEGNHTDLSFTSGSNFGFWSKYTSSNSTNFIYDDASISGTLLVDNIAPTITSIDVISSTELDISFSEPVNKTIAETTMNYITDNSIGNPLSVSVDAIDSSIVHLTNGVAFTNGSTYNMTITNIEDSTSNIMTDKDTSFLYFITVPATNSDVVINEIFADPSPVIGLPAIEYLELYNTSSSIFNLKNWQYVNSSTSKTIDTVFYLYPSSYVILCSVADTALFSTLGNVIGIAGSWTALSNSTDSITIIDNLGTVTDIVNYSSSWYNDEIKDDGGYSLELINPNAICGSGSSNWTASNDISGGTPGTQNSVYDITPDVTNPSITNIGTFSTSILEITFDEAMDSSNVVAGTYTFDNGLIAQSISVTENYATAYIQLNNPIIEGTIYNVTVSNITDCSGNNLITYSTDFFNGSAPLPGDIIITEIMADPNPVVGLPIEEYFEIYNKSSKFIDLSGCELDGSAILSGFILPGEYFALTANADTALFSPFGNVIGVSPAPSISNAGQLLILTDATGTVLDQVEFNIDWYNDPLKDDGGYSLELINPEAICLGGTNNWTASNDVTGGTPGVQNSVYDISPDITSPDLVSIDVISDTSIVLNFSEPMDTTSMLSGTYTVTGSLSVTDVDLYANDYSNVVLYLSASIDTSVTYTVTTTNLIDCPGNLISANNTGNFVVGYTPNIGEVIINEIFADPSPVIAFPNGEFVELYNKTDKLFDLSNYNINGKNIANGFIEPNGYVTLCHVDDTSGFAVLGKTIGLSSSPDITNSGEYIFFEAPDGTTIDGVQYDINWHTNTEKSKGGYSLELVNPEAPCSGANNWASTNSIDGATPGIKNSVYDTSPDIIAPQFIAIQVSSSSSIVATFDEPIDTNNLNSLLISITPSLTNNIVSSVNSFANQIDIGFTTDMDTAVIYTVHIQNMQDCIGNINTTGGSLSFEIGYSPEPGDIVINEIFIDPSPIVGLPEAEYIELYNKSDKKMDLSKVKINGSLVSPYLLAPDSYAILVDGEITSLFSSYPHVAGVDSWHSLDNTSKELTLTNLNDDIIDYIYYFNTWYNDDEKDNGGWSIERKNPNSDCNFGNNWQASTNSLGGTPGAINSIFSTDADLVAPIISKIEVIDSITLNIVFSKSMDANSLISGGYAISNNYNVASFNIDSTNYMSVVIVLDTYLTEGILQTISISNVTDCPGNIIGTNNTDFVLPQQGEFGDLVINEVLFDPFNNGEDFVEVYNISNKYIDLGTWNLATIEDQLVSNIKPIANSQQIIFPGQYFAITKDTSAVKTSYPISSGGNYIQSLALPTYGSTDGVVILLNNNFEQIDRFDYSTDIHYGVSSDDGVSLERIDFYAATNDITNWRSAKQTAGFATPGLSNSQPLLEGEIGDLIINEVLFNPTSTGEVFIEIYNNSNITFNLGAWYLANFDGDALSDVKPISNEPLFINPGGFIAITKDSLAVIDGYPLSTGGKYIQVSTLPKYNSSDGVVILLNNNFEQVDRFDYDENMHFAILNDNDGVSLERIDFDRESNDETNWHSAAENVGYATPGLQNSQYQPAIPGDDLITVEPEIFSPDEDGYNDVVNISYQLEAPGYVGTILVYDAKGRLVRSLMVNEYLSPSGTISWDGMTDTNEKARIGIYVIFAEFYNETGDIQRTKKTCVLGANL